MWEEVGPESGCRTKSGDEPSIIATFDYAYLVSAALWGFIFFAEKPGLLTIGGMILITAAGLLVATPSAKMAPVEETGTA